MGWCQGWEGHWLSAGEFMEALDEGAVSYKWATVEIRSGHTHIHTYRKHTAHRASYPYVYKAGTHTHFHKYTLALICTHLQRHNCPHICTQRYLHTRLHRYVCIHKIKTHRHALAYLCMHSADIPYTHIYTHLHRTHAHRLTCFRWWWREIWLLISTRYHLSPFSDGNGKKTVSYSCITNSNAHTQSCNTCKLIVGDRQLQTCPHPSTVTQGHTHTHSGMHPHTQEDTPGPHAGSIHKLSPLPFPYIHMETHTYRHTSTYPNNKHLM